MGLRKIGDLKRYKEIKENCSGTVLNLGSALTPLQSYLQDYFPDTSSVDIEPNADYVQDLNDQSWKIDKKFDTIVAGEILEHIENPLQFLNNCSKLLKKDGKLILTTPNATSLIYLINPAWCVSYKGNPKDNSHISTFTPYMLKELFTKVNLRVTHIKYLNVFLSNPIAWIICQAISRLRGDIIIVGEKKFV